MSWIHIEGTTYGRPHEENPVEIVDLAELNADISERESQIAKLKVNLKSTENKDVSDKEAIDEWNQNNVMDHVHVIQDDLDKLIAKRDDILNVR